ncbi:hypothetical protein PMIN01_08452 [Paraphaeosphaeria minitans]|uniref:Uncharacterized protein n=1 Tax=Paraphaeosphaeria minitans TaxID=565426 RepID=A0A9P6KQ05_9PLEO|nr:hypothetical protein PMIN01_08452 [Paraphaeosphaeria minitans]
MVRHASEPCEVDCTAPEPNYSYLGTVKRCRSDCHVPSSRTRDLSRSSRTIPFTIINAAHTKTYAQKEVGIHDASHRRKAAPPHLAQILVSHRDPPASKRPIEQIPHYIPNMFGTIQLSSARRPVPAPENVSNRKKEVKQTALQLQIGIRRRVMDV